MRRVTIFLILAISLAPVSQVWAAQMDVFVEYGDKVIQPEFKFLRIMFIEYPDGGVVAEELAGKDESISFTVDSDVSLVHMINQDLQKRSSSTIVTDVAVEYFSSIKGNENYAILEYKINLIPTVQNFELRANDDEFARIIDSTWRGFKVDGSVLIDTEYGTFDINSPASSLNVLGPITHDIIQELNPDSIINQNILDASGIVELPLHKWHFLFDPTAIIEEAKNAGYVGDSVVSHYTMGECNIEVGPCSDREWEETILADTAYTIRVIESQDDATISIEGYVVKENIIGLEIFGINENTPLGTTTPGTDEFPATVIYGMAGVAAIGSVVFFFVSNKKLKSEEGQGQRGIDPSNLITYHTSQSTGGYRTNRGESYLRHDNVLYDSKMPI